MIPTEEDIARYCDNPTRIGHPEWIKNASTDGLLARLTLNRQEHSNARAILFGPHAIAKMERLETEERLIREELKRRGS